jgi:hypothetical protein
MYPTPVLNHTVFLKLSSLLCYTHLLYCELIFLIVNWAILFIDIQVINARLLGRSFSTDSEMRNDKDFEDAFFCVGRMLSSL